VAETDRHEYIHPDDWERVARETQDKFLSGLPHEFEVRLRGKDGKYRWFLRRRNPVRDEQGRLTRWYSAATDIDDRKRAEQRLRDENIALREEVESFSRCPWSGRTTVLGGLLVDPDLPLRI
jgi:hypothetical protein